MGQAATRKQHKKLSLQSFKKHQTPECCTCIAIPGRNPSKTKARRTNTRGDGLIRNSGANDESKHAKTRARACMCVCVKRHALTVDGIDSENRKLSNGNKTTTKSELPMATFVQRRFSGKKKNLAHSAYLCRSVYWVPHKTTIQSVWHSQLVVKLF